MGSEVEGVVVTGMGAVSALGTGCAAHRQALREGRDGLRPVERFDVSAYGNAVAGTWPAWDGQAQTTSFDEGASGDRRRLGGGAFSTVEMTLAAVDEAWRAAGLAGRDTARVALVIGTCFGQDFSWFHEIAEAVAAARGLGGPALTISTACSSSTNAVGLARDLLLRGSADVVLAGGVDVFSPEVLAGFSALGVVSRAKCAPFSQPYGINLAEGAGIVVLERTEDARQRGARPLATIVGYALSADAFHETTPDPTGSGLERAIRWALADAGIEPAAIDHVNAHATGTESNDRTEWGAVERALAPRTAPVPTSGLKSFLGHAQGASGVLEMILGVLAMDEGTLPPTLRFDVPRPGAPPDPVPGPRVRPARVRHALNVSAAFGGANAVMVYGAPDNRPNARAPMASAPVLIRGLGVVSVAGLGLPALAASLADTPGAALVGHVPAIDLSAIVPTANPRGADPSTVYLTSASALALREAGVVLRGSQREATGLFLAATRMPADSARRCHASLRDHGPPGMSAAAFARMAVNAPAGACAKYLGLKGPLTTLTIGAGSGLAAVAYAADWLSTRRDAERILATAVDEGSQSDGAVAAVLARAGSGEGAAGPGGDVAIAGWAFAGPGEAAVAARAALGDHPCPDGIWGEGEGARAALAPLVPDAGTLPLGFQDLSLSLPAATACASAVALALAVTALRERRARSILLVAAAGRSASVAVLLRRSTQ